MKIETMTLDELKDEEKRLIEILQGKDGNWNDARKFNMVVNAIRYITDMKGWAAKLSDGKANRNQVAMAPKPRNAPQSLKKSVQNLNSMGSQLDAALRKDETSNSNTP